MSVGRRFESVDRRYIFLVILAAVILSLKYPIGLKIEVSVPVRRLYDAIEVLEEGAKVVISSDYGPSTMPEVYPMNQALVRHCFQKNLRVIGMALWPQGVLLAQQAMENAAEEFGKEYGRDFVNLGYKAGGVVVISSAADDIVSTFPQDYAGTSIDEIGLMDGVENFDNLEFIVSLSAGDPGVREWVMIAQGRYGKRVGAGVTAVSAPAFYPYLHSGQLVGLLGGMRGAAEYETLMDEKGTASAGMDAQSIVHGLIVFFILFGNLFYLIGKRRKE